MRRLILVICLLAAYVCSSAQDVREQEERKARLEREIAIIDRQLSENAAKSNAALSDLSLLRKKISNRKELLAQSEKQVRKYADRIYLTQRKINSMQARIDTLTERYSRLVYSAYKNRDARLWYMYMLASDDIAQAFRRFGYFKNLSGQMNKEARSILAAKEELELQKEELSRLKKEAQSVKDERAKELQKLSKDEKASSAVVRQLNRNKKKYSSQLAAKKKEVEKLNREIERLVTEAVGGKEGRSGKKKTEIDMKLAAEFSKNKGKLPWPADGPVVGRFGRHFHPVYKNLELPPNNGVDIALSKDSAVMAVFDGVVSQVLVMPGYNQCVLIQHGNYFSFYCKLKSLSVKAGDKVKTGQKVGNIDTINGQTQLHFQVWQGTKPQNPEHWLK